MGEDVPFGGGGGMRKMLHLVGGGMRKMLHLVGGRDEEDVLFGGGGGRGGSCSICHIPSEPNSQF